MRLIKFVFLLSCILTVGVVSPRAAVASEQAVQPSVGAPGSVFAFFATGFQGEEWVYYWVNDPSTRVYEGGSVRANMFSRADWTWTSPQDAMQGQWSMVAYGGKSHEVRVLSFEIAPVVATASSPLPAGQESSEVAVTPSAGAPGTAFDIFATGFHEVERVVFWGTDPNGRVYELGAAGSNEHGRVDWTWKSPPDTIPGIWTIRMQSDISRVERILTLEIIADKDYPEIAVPIDTYDSAITPVRGLPGTWFTFFITNFIDGETVEYSIIDPYGMVVEHKKVSANNRGRVDWEWTAPKNANPGTWRLEALGTASRLERVLTFEIVLDMDTTASPPAEAYDSAISPTEGAPGTTFLFFATGFGDKEPVDYQMITPDGQLFERGSVRSSPRGRADWEWESPTSAQPGVWTTIAIGRDSHARRELTFTVR